MIHEGTITYVTVDKNGNDKTMKESYIFLDNNSFADVEQKAEQEFSYLTDFDFVAVKRSKLKEVINKRESETDSIFIADVVDIQENPETGEPTEIMYKMALFASCYDEANTTLKEFLRQGYDLDIVGMKKTRIKDVIS